MAAIVLRSVPQAWWGRRLVGFRDVARRANPDALKSQDEFVDRTIKSLNDLYGLNLDEPAALAVAALVVHAISDARTFELDRQAFAALDQAVLARLSRMRLLEASR